MTAPDDSEHTGAHQLPEFKPKGMSKGDKIAAWVLAFIVVLFTLGVVSQKMGLTNPVSHPVPTATASAKATPKPTKTPKINPNALTIHLTTIDKWYIDAYASLHHVSEQKAAAALIQAGIKAQH